MDNKICKRAKNFSKIEIQELVENIAIQRQILFGPQKGTPFQRNRAWEFVAKAVNGVSETPQLRKVEDIKKKFKDLKNRTKMRLSLIEQDMVGSDAKSRKLSRIDKLIMSFIDDSNRTDKEESNILLSEIKIENLHEEEEDDPLDTLIPERILVSIEKQEDISPKSLIFEESSENNKELPEPLNNPANSEQLLIGVKRINENLEKLVEIQEKRLQIEKRKLEILEESFILKKAKYSS